MFWNRGKTVSAKWRRVDLPGHEAATLRPVATGWELSGDVEVSFEGEDYALSYVVACDKKFRTSRFRFAQSRPGKPFDIEYLASDVGWSSNGGRLARPAFDGCLDVDFSFSPATNLLPIRRLNLSVGASSSISVLWMPFPYSFERQEQRYTRVADRVYRFEANDGEFTVDLIVDEVGFVIDYPGLWTRERDS